MELVFEQECPQCGGTVELAESDHLLPCPYCGIKSFLVTRSYMRLVLPPKVDDGEIIYVPYLRCKGSVYNCHGNQISFKLIDFTNLGTPLNILPRTLGIRPQAMKMQFASPEHNGVFLKNLLKKNKAVARAVSRAGTALNDEIHHRAFIGETISLIYLPLIRRDDRLFDAITNDSLAKLTTGSKIFDPVIDHSADWKPRVISTICPGCGWNLDGESDSVVMTCQNCGSFWEATDHGFRKLPFSTIPTRDSDSEYLPFWKIQVEIEALHIKSFGDFIKATRQPRVAQADWAQTPLHIWIPAFKIKPKIFLRLGSQLTLGQQELDSTETFPEESPIHSINLPRNEAIQSLKIMLVAAAINKKDIIPKLPQIKFSVSQIELALLPFNNDGYSLYQKQTKLNINLQILKYGRHL